jgi:hypothetical protein
MQYDAPGYPVPISVMTKDQFLGAPRLARLGALVHPFPFVALGTKDLAAFAVKYVRGFVGGSW